MGEGLAGIGLATFTLDPRDTGARGGVEQAVAAIRKPKALRAMVNTVVDLRKGLDHLQQRPECHANLAYIGTSFGGVVGAILGGRDPRVKAVVLTSIGATFKQAMLVMDGGAKHIPGLPVEVPGAATDPAILAHAVRVLGPSDPVRWVGRIAPRPLLLINGRFDPLVVPGDALELAAATGDPTTVLDINGAHDPFAPGPDRRSVLVRVARFLIDNFGLSAAP